MSIKQFKDNLEDLKDYLTGNIPEKEKEELYKLLIDKKIPNEIKFLVFNQIKKREDLFDIEKLAKILNLPEIVIKKIFKSIPIEVKFPIALNEKSELATAYIIPLTKPIEKMTFSTDKEIEQGLKTIKTFLQNKKYSTQNFFVIFDKNFTGKSFLLSIVAGLLLPKENIKDFAFTGVINEEGEVFQVGYIPAKSSAAKNKDLKLITPEEIDTIDELVYYLGDEPIDIPFILMVSRPENESFQALDKLEKKIKEIKPYFSLEKLKKFFDIDLENLILHYKERLPIITEEQVIEENPWIQQVLYFETKLKNIYSKLKFKNRILHLGMAVPASLSMALGIKLGTKKPIVIYHYQSDEYIPVIDLSKKEKLRKIKYIKKNIYHHLQNIEFNISENSKNRKNFAVSIWLASHSPYSDTEHYIESKNKDWGLIKIESKEFQGDIPMPGEFENIAQNYWINYVSEIYSTLNIIKNENKIDNFHFFLSVPVPIAFALGMAIGHFWNGFIYNYDQKLEERYYPVFSLNYKRLKSIF